VVQARGRASEKGGEKEEGGKGKKGGEVRAHNVTGREKALVADWIGGEEEKQTRSVAGSLNQTQSSLRQKKGGGGKGGGPDQVQRERKKRRGILLHDNNWEARPFPHP